MSSETAHDIAARIDALLPQTQCTRCGYAGCSPYAAAVAEGEAQIFGRLMSMAGGLVEPLGKKNVQKLIDGLQAALG